MRKKQVRVYVNTDEWDVLRADAGTEDDKEIHAYLMRFYSALSQLKAINPDPIVAIGVAIANHQTLNYMRSERQTSFPPVEQRISQTTAQPVVSRVPEPSALPVRRTIDRQRKRLLKNDWHILKLSF